MTERRRWTNLLPKMKRSPSLTKLSFERPTRVAKPYFLFLCVCVCELELGVDFSQFCSLLYPVYGVATLGGGLVLWEMSVKTSENAKALVTL